MVPLALVNADDSKPFQFVVTMVHEDQQPTTSEWREENGRDRSPGTRFGRGAGGCRLQFHRRQAGEGGSRKCVSYFIAMT